MRRMAQFTVAEEVIRAMMRMPEGTEIRNIFRDHYREDQFVFVVEHPDLPEVPPDGIPVQITPSVETVSWNWNVPKEKEEHPYKVVYEGTHHVVRCNGQWHYRLTWDTQTNRIEKSPLFKCDCADYKV